VIAWLKQDYGLGRGHSMAIYAIVKSAGAPRASAEDRLGRLFGGGAGRLARRPGPAARAAGRGRAVIDLSPTDSYVGLLHEGRKFAIFSPAIAHLDIGLRRTAVPTTARFLAAGTWTQHGHASREARSRGGARPRTARLDPAAYEERG